MLPFNFVFIYPDCIWRYRNYNEGNEFRAKMVNFVAKDIYTKDSIQRGGQDVIIEKHEIQIDQITSGKVNIFTFYRNRKQIDDHFYDCKNHRLQQTTSSIFILMQRACIYCRKSFRAYIRTTVVKRFTTGRKR